jgi:hypothetical protein
MKTFLMLVITLFAPMSDCNDKKTVVGYLQYFGSEPFPQLAVVTEEYGRFFLDLTPEKRDSLMKDKTEFIRITGKVYEDKFLGTLHPFIRLEKWEWLEKPD